jgi:hypothetical protein
LELNGDGPGDLPPEDVSADVVAYEVLGHEVLEPSELSIREALDHEGRIRAAVSCSVE